MNLLSQAGLGDGNKTYASDSLGELAGSLLEEENESVQARITVLRTIILSACLVCGFRPGWSPATPLSHPPPEEMRVDVNHASVEELMKIPGMTRSWAGRIVRFRPYRTKQDLVEYGIITSEMYERIKDYIIAHRQKQ
jgi:DNA uptake protein ComE-like DNA-binding protein